MATLAAMLPVAMAVASALVGSGRLKAEPARKLLHVGLGVVALTLPWTVGSGARVVLLTLIAAGWFATIRRSAALQRRFGRVLWAVGRESAGEFHFTAGTCLTYLAARGEPLDYCLPMAILVFADSAAALIGTRPGLVRHPLGARGKSWEGSAAFFTTAFATACLAFALTPAPLPAPGVLLAIIVAFDATLLELCGRRGTDNLLIPLGVCMLLVPLERAAAATLILHLVVIGCAAIALWRRHGVTVMPS